MRGHCLNHDGRWVRYPQTPYFAFGKSCSAYQVWLGGPHLDFFWPTHDKGTLDTKYQCIPRGPDSFFSGAAGRQRSQIPGRLGKV